MDKEVQLLKNQSSVCIVVYLVSYFRVSQFFFCFLFFDRQETSNIVGVITMSYFGGWRWH